MTAAVETDPGTVSTRSPSTTLGFVSFLFLLFVSPFLGRILLVVKDCGPLEIKLPLREKSGRDFNNK